MIIIVRHEVQANKRKLGSFVTHRKGKRKFKLFREERWTIEPSRDILFVQYPSFLTEKNYVS